MNISTAVGDEKVVLITGAARGLGFAHATRFDAAGYRVVVTDLDESAARFAAGKLGGLAVGWRLDVRDPASVDEAFALVDGEWGRLDVLVNNAGTTDPMPAVGVTEKVWAELVDVHLGGTFRCAKRAHPLLAQSGGAIVNTSSLAGILGHGRRAPYAAAKAGVMGLTRDLAVEWADDGIRVNAIAPGLFMTDLIERHTQTGELSIEAIAARVPLARAGRLSELADVCYFLAEIATYMTGQTLVVDGGLTIAPSW